LLYGSDGAIAHVPRRDNCEQLSYGGKLAIASRPRIAHL
jgi:hypothetical protein